jgi:hypothetical protein
MASRSCSLSTRRREALDGTQLIRYFSTIGMVSMLRKCPYMVSMLRKCPYRVEIWTQAALLYDQGGKT